MQSSSLGPASVDCSAYCLFPPGRTTEKFHPYLSSEDTSSEQFPAPIGRMPLLVLQSFQEEILIACKDLPLGRHWGRLTSTVLGILASTPVPSVNLTKFLLFSCSFMTFYGGMSKNAKAKSSVNGLYN